MGSRPTFVGIACADEPLGRAFACELICAGRLWRWLRRSNLLFTVTENLVEVRVDLAVRYSSRLSRLATELVLPAARRGRDAAQAAAERRRTAREHLAHGMAALPWLRHAVAGADLEAEAVAIEVAGGKCLVVLGTLEQSEADDLARAARLTGHWSPERMGNTVLICGRAGIGLTAESSAAEPLLALTRFMGGFLRLVAISDLHLGVKGRDTFGAHKEPALVRLLDEVIEQRATLILNGDFLELMHESYGAIKRSYPEVFARLARVRRIIYVPGNHDEEILRDRIKEVRQSTRRRAERHAYASVRHDETKRVGVEPRPWALLHPRLQAWRDILADPRLASWLEEVLTARHGSIHLSHGFPEEGVAFRRGGPRDTPEERPVWYLDDSTLREADPAARILKLVSDRRQRLDRVIDSDWGGQVRIAPYHFDPARGIYFEHGHAAVPSCNGSWLGPAISRLGGWIKRCGVTHIEHLVEERLGRHVRAIYPFGRVREMNQFIERALAVTTWLVHGEKISHPALFFGHTHEPAAVAADPVHAFTTRLVGASCGNTGAWSSRLRSNLPGNDLVEWLEVDASGSVQAHMESASHRSKP